MRSCLSGLCIQHSIVFFEAGFKKRDADVVGDNGCVNGMWWADRRCVWRDGGHGSLESGICGTQGKGAFAMEVLSSAFIAWLFGGFLQRQQILDLAQQQLCGLACPENLFPFE